jgi:hypothetical protein
MMKILLILIRLILEIFCLVQINLGWPKFYKVLIVKFKKIIQNRRIIQILEYSLISEANKKRLLITNSALGGEINFASLN